MFPLRSIVPQLKLRFFNEPVLKVFLSNFVWAYIVICYVIGFLLGFILRVIMRLAARNKSHGAAKNINVSDRVFRLALGIGLFVGAVTTSWNPIMLILSGFTVFEAMFSWCVVYAAMGKNTCSA
jgi:hypothetical protein